MDKGVFMDNMKRVESCLRNMGLTKLQIRSLVDKISEYAASNKAAGISAESEEEWRSRR